MKKMKFKDLPISHEVIKATKEMKFKNTTEVQQKAIPALMYDKDIIAQSQTGTGKTASFAIPMIEKVSLNSGIEGIVICPTRELALQVVREFESLAKYKQNVKLAAVYGGASARKQISKIKKGANIIVGTPGRIIDLINRGAIKLSGLKFACLDEADEMLNMGFIDDIEKILKNSPKNRQTILFSATMPNKIKKIARKYQNNPKIIKVTRKNLTVNKINEYSVKLKKGQKFEVLKRTLFIENPEQALIFCNTKRMVDKLVLRLQKDGLKADFLHGDLKQNQRDRVMNKFRKNKIEYLIATDVAARGIDVDNIQLVVNYDLPQNKEYYVHRIGRTGRAGRKGKAMTFVYGKELRNLRSLERYTKSKMKKMAIPSHKDYIKAKKNKSFNDLTQKLDNIEINNQVDDIYNKLLNKGYSEEKLIKLLLSKEVKIQKEKKKKKTKKNNKFLNTGAEPGMARLFVNIGKNHKIRTGDILGAVAGESNISGRVVGAIDIFKNFSFVEVPLEKALHVIESLRGINMKGQKLNVEPANAR